MSYGNRSNGNRYGGRSGGYSGGGGGGGGGYNRYGGNNEPKPVEVGTEYDVEITELSRRGDGVAKIKGFIVFVKGSRVGDKAKIKVDTVGPRFATASVVGKSSGPASGGETSSESGDDSGSSSMTEPVS
jgi:predicted RNA-binding protein with TRAM domain